jgi:hypothetical protein
VVLPLYYNKSESPRVGGPLYIAFRCMTKWGIRGWWSSWPPTKHGFWHVLFMNQKTTFFLRNAFETYQRWCVCKNELSVCPHIIKCGTWGALLIAAYKQNVGLEGFLYVDYGISCATTANKPMDNPHFTRSLSLSHASLSFLGINFSACLGGL